MKYFTKYYAKILKKQPEEVREHAKRIIEAQKAFVVQDRFGVEDDKKFKSFRIGKKVYY